MKKLAASFNAALPPVASAATNDEVQVCRLLVELRFFDSHGACICQLRKSIDGASAHQLMERSFGNAGVAQW